MVISINVPSDVQIFTIFNIGVLQKNVKTLQYFDNDNFPLFVFLWEICALPVADWNLGVGVCYP